MSIRVQSSAFRVPGSDDDLGSEIIARIRNGIKFRVQSSGVRVSDLCDQRLISGLTRNLKPEVLHSEPGTLTRNFYPNCFLNRQALTATNTPVNAISASRLGYKMSRPAPFNIIPRAIVEKCRTGFINVRG
jgi:hypothetical protein